jgi:hypothetical protein
LANESFVILSESEESQIICFGGERKQQSEMFRFAQHDTRHFPRLSEAIPGITLKAA